MKEHDRHLMDLWDGNAAPQNDEDRLWLDLKDDLRSMKPQVESRTQFADVMREVRLASPAPAPRRPWWKWAVPSGAVAAASLYFLLIARPDAIPQPDVIVAPGTNSASSGNLATNSGGPVTPEDNAAVVITPDVTVPGDFVPEIATTPSGVGDSTRRNNTRRNSRPAGEVATRLKPTNAENPTDTVPDIASMARPSAGPDSPSAARGSANNAEVSESNATNQATPVNNGPKVVVVGNRPSANTGVPRATEAPLTDVVFGG